MLNTIKVGAAPGNQLLLPSDGNVAQSSGTAMTRDLIAVTVVISSLPEATAFPLRSADGTRPSDLAIESSVIKHDTRDARGTS